MYQREGRMLCPIMTATSTVSLASRGTKRMTVLDAARGAHRGSREGQMGALNGGTRATGSRPVARVGLTRPSRRWIDERAGDEPARTGGRAGPVGRSGRPEPRGADRTSARSPAARAGVHRDRRGPGLRRRLDWDARALMNRGIPFLTAVRADDGVWLGPAVVPSAAGCIRCWQTRRQEHAEMLGAREQATGPPWAPLAGRGCDARRARDPRDRSAHRQRAGSGGGRGAPLPRPGPGRGAGRHGAPRSGRRVRPLHPARSPLSRAPGRRNRRVRASAGRARAGRRRERWPASARCRAARAGGS